MRRPRVRDEDGFVLAWMAIFLVVLLAFAGFAVDVAHWYLAANRLQNAADSAALGGVTFLPGDRDTAYDTARALSARNGFPDGAPVSVTPEQLAKPSQLRVSVSSEVNNFFAQVLGFDSLRITRDAVAEFQGPIAMGSPVNTMGNEPVKGTEAAWTTGSVAPQFWLNVAGPGTTKVSGDRHQAGECSSAVSRCSGAVNSDYATEGYFFVVRVGADADLNRRLAIDVFDPAFVQVGDNCSANTLHNAAALDASPSRYAAGPTSPFCTGDHQVNGSTANNPVTTFAVRAPDPTPWIDTDNPVISAGSVTVDGAGTTATECGPKQYRPANGGVGFIANRIQTDAAFRAYFRKWVRICTVPVGGPGDYLVQVRTNATVGSPLSYDPSITTRGHNRFSIRAAMVSAAGAASGTGVQVFAAGRLPVYANASGADTRFHLARLLPGNGNRILHVQFFDTGDAGQPGTIQVLPPDDSNVGSLTNCRFTRDGASSVTSPNCSLSNVSSSAGYNGRIVDAEIPVPDGYTCDQASASGCWVRLRFQYPSGTSVQDTTTWSADMVGDPVRLIE